MASKGYRVREAEKIIREGGKDGVLLLLRSALYPVEPIQARELPA